MINDTRIEEGGDTALAETPAKLFDTDWDQFGPADRLEDIWFDPESKMYRCEIRLEPDVGGGYSAYIPELPGVVSEGETEQEAVGNISEALRGALRSYLDSEQPIPWRKEVEPLRIDEVRTWIVVDV